MSELGPKVEANIYRTPNLKGFIAVANIPYKDESGKTRYRRPHKTRESLEQARQWLAEIRAKHTLGLLPARAQTDIETIGGLIAATNPEKMALRSWRSVVRRRKAIVDYFGEQCRVANITRRSVGDYRRWLGTLKRGSRGRGSLSPVTINRYMEELKWLLRYAADEEVITRPPKFPPAFPLKNQRPLNISLVDFWKVIDDMPLPQACVMAIALNTGARFTDAAAMTWERLIRAKNGPVFTVRNSKRCKDFIQIPALRQVLLLLQRYWEEYGHHNEYLVVNPKTQQPFGDIGKALENAITRMGVARFTFHTIKHLAITTMLDLTNGDLDMVSRIVGTSRQTLERYYGHLAVRHSAVFQQFDQVLDKVVGQSRDTFAIPSGEKVIPFRILTN